MRKRRHRRRTGRPGSGGQPADRDEIRAPDGRAWQVVPDLILTKISRLPPGIEQIRTIEIVGLDLQADGGTHVANTLDVGGIRVTSSESKGRINKQIRVELVDPG